MDYIYSNTLFFYRIYNRLVDKGLKRGLDKDKLDYYTEKHHILPRCMGGKDEDNNYVLFTAKEHILAHMLLHRLYPEIDGLLYAINLMLQCDKGTNMRVSIRMGAYYREDAGKLQRDKVISEEQKKKISESKLGKPLGKPSDEHRRKISESKKGKDLGNEVIDKDGNIFPTVKDCAKFHNTTIGMIHYWINKRPDKGFKYTGNHTKIPSSRSKKVQGPDGTVYNSMRECYEKTGHDRHTVLGWIRDNPDKGWKFLDN